MGQPILGRRARVKRSIDVVGALGGLIILSPVLLAIAALIRVTSGPPFLFRQARPGLDGRILILYKFRTMRNRSAETGDVAEDERITALGRFLRRTSLDELPELWNVLRGDMSLVGPRPLLVDYLPLYTQEQARRHEVRPGITGLAQVSGRNSLEWEERFELDVWYVDHWTVALDLRILARTFLKVFRMEGISGREREIMEPFRGRSDQAPRIG